MPTTAPYRGAPDLISDLVWLRKGRGLTSDRLSQAGAVVAACGGGDSPIETVHERLLSALRSMQDSNGGRALWAAYGIDDQDTDHPSLLRERRADHAARVNRSADTVHDWEAIAIQELAWRLLSGYYAGAALPGTLPIPHGGFLLSRLDVSCMIDDRRFVQSQQSRTIISLVDGAPHFVYGTYSPTELDGLQGGRLALSKQMPGGTLHKIDFTPELTRGQLHSFSFRETVPSDHPVPDTLVDFCGQSFESPTLRYTVTVRFLGERPEAVWCYDKLSRIERPGEPTASNVLELDQRGQVSTGFADLYGGLCSGVAWRWGTSRPAGIVSLPRL